MLLLDFQRKVWSEKHRSWFPKALWSVWINGNIFKTSDLPTIRHSCFCRYPSVEQTPYAALLQSPVWGLCRLLTHTPRQAAGTQGRIGCNWSRRGEETSIAVSSRWGIKPTTLRAAERSRHLPSCSHNQFSINFTLCTLSVHPLFQTSHSGRVFPFPQYR